MLFWTSYWPCRNNVIVGELISYVHSSGNCCRFDGWLVPDMSVNVLITSPKIELSKKTLDNSILEDNTKIFLERPDISHPLTRGPIPKERRLCCWKSLKPEKLMSLKLLHRIRQRTQKLTKFYHIFLILLLFYCFVDQINYSTHKTFPLFSLCTSLQLVLVFT